jgi:Ser/Thr protein kinase RdoA (MazF antagonist)
MLHWVADNRATEIDHLPRALVHNDFQAKNLIIDRSRGARPVVSIIDIEQAVIETALYDLYFLLMLDDLGTGLGNWQAFEVAMRAYQEVRGKLTDNELLLLPNVLQAKAGLVAAWAANAYHPVEGSFLKRLENYFNAALECILFVNDQKDRMRLAVRQAMNM